MKMFGAGVIEVWGSIHTIAYSDPILRAKLHLKYSSLYGEFLELSVTALKNPLTNTIHVINNLIKYLIAFFIKVVKMEKPKKKKNSNGLLDHSQKAYKGIRRMLYHKELVPGQKIAYRELAEQLNMSPTPIIQALKWLEFQGFVRHEPNRGYYMEPFSLQEIEEIYELRELLEVSLLPIAIEQLNEEGIEHLKTAHEAHFSAVREFYLKERLFKNMEFHLALASLSNKRTHMRILRNIFDLLLLKYGGNYLPITSLQSGDQEHQAIFECVVSRNLKGAQRILSQHIANVKMQVLESLRQMLEEEIEPEYSNVLFKT